jgi:hypothetical protein
VGTGIWARGRSPNDNSMVLNASLEEHAEDGLVAGDACRPVDFAFPVHPFCALDGLDPVYLNSLLPLACGVPE